MARAAKITDAGVKIGGARKDFAERRLTVEDLAEMTGEEAVEAVVRENIWPTPDYEKMVADGMDPVRAAAAKLVRSRISRTPKFTRYADPAEQRREYIEIISALRDIAEDASIPVDDFYMIARSRLEDIGITSRFFDILKAGRANPIDVSRYEIGRLKAEVLAGFPGKIPPYLKGIQVRQDPRTKEVSWIAVKDNTLVLRQGFPTSEAVIEALKARYEALPAKQTADGGKKLIPERPHLDRLERTGMTDHRGGRDVSAEEYVETLGFRGVEFGNWVTQDERQTLLNMGWDAVHDLAEVVGVEPRDISLGGTLAISFGSRGKGSAPAHYEPGRRVFNLTKLTGAGAAAHEWFHAFDHYVGTHGYQGVSSGVRGASGWHDRVKAFGSHLSNRPPAERVAWSGLMDSLFEKQPSVEEFAQNIRDLIKTEIDDEVTRVNDMKARYDERVASGGDRNPKWERKVADWLVTVEKRRKAHLDRIAQAEKFGVPSSVLAPTQFYKEAAKIAGKTVSQARSGRGETNYWVRPNELSARAFECFVYDEIIAKGGRSDYLVHSVEDGLFAGPSFKGDMYPAGEERKAFNAAFRALMIETAPVLRVASLGQDVEPEPAAMRM